MSGGSFNYLAERLGSDELGSVDEYTRMATSLQSDGHKQAAALTLLLVAHLRDAALLARLLQQVHHAQEWRVSGDWGVERVAEAARALESQLDTLGFRAGVGYDDDPFDPT